MRAAPLRPRPRAAAAQWRRARSPGARVAVSPLAVATCCSPGGVAARADGPVITGEVTMVKLTCLIRRKEGMSPEDFHAYWRDQHGPLVLSTRSGSHVLRYEQHHRALSDYGPEDDGGYDGVTEQWFESMDEYNAHIAETDFADVWADIPKFLDVDRLAFVVTEEPVVILASR